MNLPFSSVSLGPTERGVLIGTTGSGKTTFAQLACSTHPYVVVLDPKGLIRWRGYEVHTSIESLVKSRAPRLLYRPTAEALRDRWASEEVNLFFAFCYERRNCMVYVDEVGSITEGDLMPPFYRDVLTRGRERRVACLSATQRPKRVPQLVFSESELFIVFRLRLEPDRAKVEETTGLDRDELLKLPKHWFYVRAEGRAQDPPEVPMKLDLSGGRSVGPFGSVVETAPPSPLARILGFTSPRAR